MSFLVLASAILASRASEAALEGVHLAGLTGQLVVEGGGGVLVGLAAGEGLAGKLLLPFLEGQLGPLIPGLLWASACSAWFWIRFWLAMAVATACLNLTRSDCMSITDWSRILAGSSALLTRSLRLARNRCG
jgi:hypothetical protein